MKNIDLEYLCTVIGNLAGIPIRVYDGENLIFYHSTVNLPKDPICVYWDNIFSIEGHVNYFITPIFNYYGIVKSENTRIIIGPTRQTNASEQELKTLAFQADVPQDMVNEFIIAMKSIIAMPLDSILQILFTINYILNEEKLSLADIRLYDTSQEKFRQILEQEQMKINAQSSDSQSKSTNNTLAIEQTIVNFVRRGNTIALKNWLSEAPAAVGGILAGEQLRQLKNTFIVTATLVSRAAIRGGMPVNDALGLSDSYIQNCELLSSVSDITNLQYRMVMDYTERVEKLLNGQQLSQLVIDVKNYIMHHISEPIKTEDIADAFYTNRSRLSTNFKKETGENLIDFILKEKVEEAKRLLRYSDKSLVAISSYLGFSSQSHFTRVFKKYVGASPTEYREKHN